MRGAAACARPPAASGLAHARRDQINCPPAVPGASRLYDEQPARTARAARTDQGEHKDGLLVWPDLLTRERPQPSATIAYGSSGLQVVDLWLPAGKGPHPTVLMVHGGCWQTEIADRRIMNWISDDLRRRGIAVWNIDYRGVDKEGGGYPGTFLDAAAAADALRAHAPRYNLDIDPLVAVGHSAGGHLALWLAARRHVSARATTLIVTAVLPGIAPEEVEARRTRPIERIARSAPGVRALHSTITETSRTFVVFQTPAQAQAAEKYLEAEVAKAGLTGVDVSSPGHIAEGSPIFSSDPLRVHHVVSLGGLPDLEEAARPPGSGCGTEVIAQLTGAATAARPDVFADTSVPRLAPLGVEQVLINGEQDRIIPTAYAEGYAAPMRAKGDKVRVRMIDRTGHVELIAPESAAWAATVEEIRSALGMKGSR